jgi:hypothetical protein
MSAGFAWLDREGQWHSLADLPAKRLFYTWLMLWNHHCPVNQQVWFTHKYSFNPLTHSPAYLMESLTECTKVLGTRKTELGPKMLQVFEQVLGYCQNG